MEANYTRWTVTIGFTWQEDGDGSPYTFGSLEGARRGVSRWLEGGEVAWYSIEGTEWYPCIDTEPDGQLYGGMIHREYHETGKAQKARKEVV